MYFVVMRSAAWTSRSGRHCGARSDIKNGHASQRMVKNVDFTLNAQ